MTYSSELYQQMILEHNRKPRNFREMKNSTHNCHGYNPMCAISKASASLMTSYLKEKKVDESRLVFNEFHKMLLGEFDSENNKHHLGKLTLFLGVREFPSRIKCASLSWHTMIGALDKNEVLSTE